MKKYILVVLVSLAIYFIITTIYALFAPYDISEWSVRFLMLGNVLLTTMFVYLIFKKPYSIKLFGAFIVTIIISAILKYITDVLYGDLSFSYLLVIGVLIVYVIEYEKGEKE